ncbi:MAG: M55 family metallopeptidase [Thermotaleaceae bacterium]
MKFFISADIEGTTGIVHWDETNLEKSFSRYFCEQMTREVKAACEGAIEAGAQEILLKDAHDSARNIDPSQLPEIVKIMRGWARNPLIMMAGLDSSFDGVIFTGYHSPAGSNANPLAHTMNRENVYVKINGQRVSEFTINAYIAAYLNVPVLFLSGDKELCESVKALNENIKTVATCEGIGDASISIHPALAVEQIKKGVAEAAKDDLSKYRVELPANFEVEICYKHHVRAYKAGFYPGAEQIEADKVIFKSKDYMDVLKFLFFVL